MGCSRSLILFINLAITLNLVALIIAQDDDASCTERADYCWKCTDGATYTPGDIYQVNLKSLLSSFSNTQNNYGFYNSSMGKHPNNVNAIALCRGDLSQDLCQACLNTSIDKVLQTYCPTQKEAIFWAERCMVRYSYNLIYGIEKQYPVKYVPGAEFLNNPQPFRPVLDYLLHNLSDRAASVNSPQKFAAGRATVLGA